MPALHGVIPAMVTPRDDATDDVDWERLKRLASDLLAAGCHGLFPTSSTGEAPLLTCEQRQRVIETVVEAAGGRTPVLGGAGAASTTESIRLARDAQTAGVTHLAILPTHFVPLPPDELYGYFAAVADSVNLPTILYNYPARTNGQNIPASVAAKLAQNHNVIGLKDSGGDLTNGISYLDACGPNFALFAGPESLVYPMLAMGGAGTICAAANVCAPQLVALYEAFQAGNHAAARQWQEAIRPLRRIFATGTFPASVKAALGDVGGPFPPALPLSDAQREHVRRTLAEIPTSLA